MLLSRGSSSRGHAAKVGLEPLERREGPTKCFETSLFEDEEHLDWIGVAIRTAEPTLLLNHGQGRSGPRGRGQRRGRRRPVAVSSERGDLGATANHRERFNRV